MEQKKAYVDDSIGIGYFMMQFDADSRTYTQEPKKDKNGNVMVELTFTKDIKAGTKATLFRAGTKRNERSPDFRILPKMQRSGNG